MFRPSASKAIAELPKSVKQRVIARIEHLGADPRPVGCVKLAGYDNWYRIRIGQYRVVYEVRNDGRVVVVLVVAHRRDVYRGL